MNILAINTIDKDYSVALLSTNKILFKSNKIIQKNILHMINDVLYYSNINLSKINLVVFNNGPGSFSGIRLSSAFANVLKLSLGTKYLSISNMDILFYKIKQLYSHKIVVLIIFNPPKEFFICKYFLKYNKKFFFRKNNILKYNSIFEVLSFLKEIKNNFYLYINKDFYIFYKKLLINNFYIIKKIHTNAQDLICLIELLDSDNNKKYLYKKLNNKNIIY